MPMIELQASDGHVFAAYRADPASTARGGIVVVQEIFGVNEHIRDICDRLAGEGYAAIAPAIFDRQERGFETGYSPAEIEQAKRFIPSLDFDGCLRDVDACREELSKLGRVGIVGFCLGGTIAYLAATRLGGVSAASCFYGGMIQRFADEVPRCATELHYGADDQSIPEANYRDVEARRPDVSLFVYEGAGHGFNCDRRASYAPQAAGLAWSRALALFASKVGSQGIGA